MPAPRRPAPPACPRARHRGGFTLIECTMVCAVAAVLAGLAFPSYRQQQLRMARLDAVDALTRLQAAQERYRAATGLYAPDLATLRGIADTSPQQRYHLDLAATGPDSYRATAQARGDQAADTDCAAITLDVNQGYSRAGPRAGCWNR